MQVGPVTLFTVEGAAKVSVFPNELMSRFSTCEECDFIRKSAPRAPSHDSTIFILAQYKTTQLILSLAEELRQEALSPSSTN